MWARIEVEYHSDAEWEKVDWEVVKENWPDELVDKKPGDKYRAFPYSNDKARLTYPEIQALVQSGLKITMLPMPGTQYSKMRHKEPWEPYERVTPDDLDSGRAVHITVADVGLLVLNEVMVLEDACTDQLQDHLDDGWRILAVCPPVAARRPDYILGRRKMNGE